MFQLERIIPDGYGHIEWKIKHVSTKEHGLLWKQEVSTVIFISLAMLADIKLVWHCINLIALTGYLFKTINNLFA